MRIQSVIGVMATMQRKTLVVVAIMLAAGFCWQTAFADNPAGFAGGAFAYGGDPANKIYFHRDGATAGFEGLGVGGNGTFLNIVTAGAEAVGAQTGYNAISAYNRGYTYYAICTQRIGNACTQGSFSESYYAPPGSPAEGVAVAPAAILTLVGNGSGTYHGVQLSGSEVPAITINFVKENVNGQEYLTIPWTTGNTEALGIKGGFPQVHIPITNGIVAFDFNGDGVPDPDLMVSPPLTGTAAATNIPTLGEWGMILLTMLLTLGGVWMLRRSQVRISLT